MAVQDNLLDVGDKTPITPAILGVVIVAMFASLGLARLFLHKHSHRPPHSK